MRVLTLPSLASRVLSTGILVLACALLSHCGALLNKLGSGSASEEPIRFVWNAPDSSDLMNPESWNLASQPTASDTLYFRNTSSDMSVVTLSSTAEVGAIVIESGNVTLDLSADLRISSIQVKAGAQLVKSGTGKFVLPSSTTQTTVPLNVTGGAVVFNSDPGSQSDYPLDVTASAGGHVEFQHSAHLHALNLESSSSAVLAEGDSRLLRLKSLSVDPANSFLDLSDNDLIIDNEDGANSATTIYNWIIAGAARETGMVNGLMWTGNGIKSHVAAQYAANFDQKHILGFQDNATLGFTSFDGEDVHSHSLLVKFTYREDLNFNGLIDDNDVDIFSGNYNEGQPANWSGGDIDFDGFISANDSIIFGVEYSLSSPQL